MTARFIRLANPAMCSGLCGGYLKKGRGAFWDAGLIYCVKCARARGDAPIDAEEEALLNEEIDREEKTAGRRR